METSTKEHSLLKSVALHLLPGIFVGIAYFTLAPFVNEHGFPTAMALILAGVFVLAPFELGIIFFQKRSSGEKYLEGIIKYTQHIPVWQYFVWVSVILVFSGLIFSGFKFSSDFLITFFNWIPTDLFLDLGLDNEFNKQKLIITYVAFFLFMVIILPIIEEIYFRGYLLPRMPSKLQNYTVIIHSGLFAMYHTWTPWMFFIRTLALLPLIYIVKRKENILIGIIAHCILNSFDFIAAMIFILNY